MFYFQDIDRKNEQTAAILKMQGAQLAELEVLYKEEQILRKRYFNTIEGWNELINSSVNFEIIKLKLF